MDDVQKWGYGMITKGADGRVWIMHPEATNEEVQVPSGHAKKEPDELLLDGLSRVGKWGWELVAADGESLYFKFKVREPKANPERA